MHIWHEWHFTGLGFDIIVILPILRRLIEIYYETDLCNFRINSLLEPSL